MVAIGSLVNPGDPAPARGTYLCTESGCTGSFVASMKGTPLPPAHHAGASWRLAEVAKGRSAPPRDGRVSPGAAHAAGEPPCS